MTTFTGGAFLVSMALLLGASNLEIGVLAALPMFTNIFQLLSIYLVGKYNNRRAVTVYCAFLARIPLIIVGILVLTSANSSVSVLIFFLFFYYLFGSIAGPSWNSWMKDMAPESMLGEYFSKRGCYNQTLNVVLSIVLAGIYSRYYLNIALLVVLHIFTGIATAGINLSLTNMGLKLSPKKDAIVYLSVKNIITAVFSSLGPLIGGVLADLFAERSLTLNATWTSTGASQVVRTVSLHEWNFLFLIGALLALISLELLSRVNETGEIHKDVVRRIMRKSISSNLKDYFIIGDIISMHQQLRAVVRSKRKKFTDRMK